MRLQHTTRRSRTGNRGATLLVTLGILTLLSVLAITFLVVSRLQRQTAVGDQNRLVARNYMDAGLHLAMRQVEDAFTYPNYTDHDTGSGEFLTMQRLAPVGQWFSTRYDEAYNLSDSVSYKATDVLASPTLANSPHVNLITPQVMRLVPSALTNGLQLSAHQTPCFRSGWIPLDLLPTNAPVEMRLRSKPGRIAFAVFNCSGLIDANTFISGPTTQKLQRVCFSQTDVTNWFAEVRATTAFDNLTSFLDERMLPFFHLSYDPDPNVYPLHYDCFETNDKLGLWSFAQMPKFNLNTLTYYSEHTDAASGDWTLSGRFRAEWLIPVTEHVLRMSHEEAAVNPNRVDLMQSIRIPWNIANFMDLDRIPQISPFINELDLATREKCAVEDVPLINRIKVFNIFEKEERPDPKCDPEFYKVDRSLSNHYAVAIELWYPFAPNRPPKSAALYAGIYTNEEDVVTTTNRPWTQNQIRDWLNWNSADTSNSVMKTLFYNWARTYTNTVNAIDPSILKSNPLWKTITDQGDLWFTPAMTNHPSWPVADTNGVFSITNTPIWQAFYPETNVVAVTNADGSTTNIVYTNLAITNYYVDWVSESDTPVSTNRLVGNFEPYPVLLWSNLITSAYTTNALVSFDDQSGTTVPFYPVGLTNQLNTITATSNTLIIVVSNRVSGVVSTNETTTLYLSTNGLTIAIATNFNFTTEVLKVEPLPMPPRLGESLAALFNMLLPINSLSSLSHFMLLRPDQFTDEDWDKLFNYFSQSPSIVDTVMPANRTPTLGAMTEEDRYALTDIDGVPLDEENDNGWVSKPEVKADQFGLYWVVYPKKIVSFPEITITKPETGTGAESSSQIVTTNYFALGSKPSYRVWLRPAVTILGMDADKVESDVIVDEALLIKGGDSVQGWQAVTNLSIPDPRQNAYAPYWRGFDRESWENFVATTNLSTQVNEYPFMVFDTGFTSIGDIGHIYTSRTSAEQSPGIPEIPPVGTVSSAAPRYDTISFAARSGAALLDIFTITPTNIPTRGLVQANTQQRPVIQTLLSDIHIGWTNNFTGTIDPSRWIRLTEKPERVDGWADVYADALTNAPYSMGWRSYADMLPSLSTNRVLTMENVWGGIDASSPAHDYTEDVMRGIVDKVSFRQNIFVIIVAAQTLSPASTDTHPITLAEQRAAVTVIRDAYTGKWLVHSWVWLTE